MTVLEGTEVPRLGGRPLNLLIEWNVAGTGVRMVQSFYDLVEQDTTGNIYCLGQQAAGTTIRVVSSTAVPVEYPATIGIGQTWAYTANYDSGLVEQVSNVVLGTEAVDGQMTYKIHWSVNDGYSLRSGDEWYVPDWGFAAKATLTVDNAEGTWLLTGTITSKNLLPLPPVLDTVPPIITASTATPATMDIIENFSRTVPVIIQATATDNVRVSAVTATVPDFDSATKTVVTKTVNLSSFGGSTWSAQYIPASFMGVDQNMIVVHGGEYALECSVQITATDSSGNKSATASTSFWVTGFAPPTPTP